MDHPGQSDPRSDEQLVADINAGDVDAFKALYLRHRDWVVRQAYRVTGDRDTALDVMQETFTYLLRKFPGFVLRAKLTTFLYPVVQHLGIAARKKTARFAGVDASQVDPPASAAREPNPAAAAADPRAELAIVVAKLPEAQRQVLLLRFVDDMSLAAIAEAMAIPLGTVKSRLHHALATLRADDATRKYFDLD